MKPFRVVLGGRFNVHWRRSPVAMAAAAEARGPGGCRERREEPRAGGARPVRGARGGAEAEVPGPDPRPRALDGAWARPWIWKCRGSGWRDCFLGKVF